MSSEEKMEMLTRLFKYVDRVWEKLTDNWSYCNVCMKKDAAITILVILLVWLLV
jgi:hypothetical protein|tara:strand:+ start:132 stop:293 length:162 start_codon:yes stop_codon:yes gene_type:complete